ncbi:MAG TPA: nucleotidyltransferase [Alphaproteobacteria bacterium]|nr:nucleotidyltransferase [Alphaproteobacteria bacterium]HAJ46345.1 nucleotidyltransferase [Alphaproteobacteria bacterium]
MGAPRSILVYINSMQTDLVITKIKALEPQLRDDRVARALVFGSLARGEARDDSDIDIAIEPEEERNLMTLKVLDIYGLFGAAFGHDTLIDVVVLPHKKAGLEAAIAKDALIAFE